VPNLPPAYGTISDLILLTNMKSRILKRKEIYAPKILKRKEIYAPGHISVFRLKEAVGL
jgi:hypothetical protein